jgi:hypothetical protein
MKPVREQPVICPLRGENRGYDRHSRPGPYLAVFAVIAALLFSAGCISAVTPVGSGDAGVAPLQVHFIGQDGDWSFSRGCTWEATYQVYNGGDVTLENVRLTIELVGANSGAVRDSRVIAIGNMPPGTSRVVTAELDGECTNEYTVRAVPAFDR